MALQPLLDGLGLMDFVVIHNHIEALILCGRLGRIEPAEQGTA